MNGPRNKWIKFEETMWIARHHSNWTYILTLARNPLVKFVGPILESVDWNDDENSFSFRVAQKTVDERDHLQGLPETHAMRQDATKSYTFVELEENRDKHMAYMVVWQRLAELSHILMPPAYIPNCHLINRNLSPFRRRFDTFLKSSNFVSSHFQKLSNMWP